jgi:hypothetical protein
MHTNQAVTATFAGISTGSTVAASSGYLTGKYLCQSAAPCTLSLTFTALLTRAPSQLSARDAAAAAKKARGIVVARTTATIPAHGHREIRIALTALGRKLARRHELRRLTELIQMRTQGKKVTVRKTIRIQYRR